MPERTLLHNWKDLPNWHEASKDGFPLYRVTNDTFKDKVINGNTIHIIFIVLMLKSVIRI